MARGNREVGIYRASFIELAPACGYAKGIIDEQGVARKEAKNKKDDKRGPRVWGRRRG